jgi:hypothetical protein
MSTKPFSALGASVAVTAPSGSGSAVVTLPGGNAQTINNPAMPQFVAQGGDTCKVTNTAAVPVSVLISNGAGTVATTSNEIIPANSERVIAIPLDATSVSAFGIGGTGTVNFQRGGGGI